MDRNGKSVNDLAHSNDAAPGDLTALTLDLDEYRAFLEDCDLTDAQKAEFLQALWRIVVEFVSLGFGVHPVQLSGAACGQVDKPGANPTLTAPFVVDCLDHQPQDQQQAAAPTEAKGVAPWLKES